jgi:hypothetical protein
MIPDNSIQIGGSRRRFADLEISRRSLSNSARGTFTNRRAKDLNRSMGDLGARPLASSLASDLNFSRSRSRAFMLRQFSICQALTSDRRTHFPKPLTIIVFALIEPECLLVEIPTQVGRINAHVSTLEGAFQEAPEILDVVGVDLSANKLNRVVNHFMRVGVGKTEIGFESVGVEGGPRLDCGPNFGSQCSAADVGNVHGLDAAGSLIAGTLDDPENRFFSGTASALDLPLADVPMHVFGEATNKRFVRLYLAAHLQECASLHCQPNAMVHEPCGLLSDTERPVHLVAADPVLAVGDHPDCGKPFPEIDWAILEDSPDLCRELTPGMLLFAFPQTAGGNEPHVGATASRTADPIGPAKLDHRAQRDIRVSEMPDGVDQGLWLVLHANQYDSDRSLSQVCYYSS